MRTALHLHWGKVNCKLKGLYCPSLRCSTTVLFILKTTILDWKSLRQLFSICNFSVISLCPHKKCASLLKNQIPCAKSISWDPPPLTYWTRENYEYMHIMSNIVCGVQNRVGHAWKTQINSNFVHDCSLSQQRYINSNRTPANSEGRVSLAGSQI